jgi:hypothetical protein
VTLLTIGCLTLLIRGSTNGQAVAPQLLEASRPIVPTILDLIPMFVTASSIRTLFGSGLTLHGGFVGQFAVGSLLAAVANNLPAAAAVGIPTIAVPWAAV